MDEIKLKRGGREIVFKKHPTYFAARLKKGRTGSESALEAAEGRRKTRQNGFAS